jgi:hypothetical protein
VIAECLTGKTLISPGAVQTHAENRPFTSVAMVPPQSVEKWCREASLTLPRVRVFIIDGIRTPKLGNKGRWEYLRAIYDRYQKVVRKGKKVILGEFCANTSYHGTYAIRLLIGPPSKPELTFL